MKILITGAAGFIGSNLTNFLLGKNHQVIGIDNLITGSITNLKPIINNKWFSFYQKDILGFDFNRIGPVDIVFHLASPASPRDYQKYPLQTLMVNSLGTKILLDFIIKTKSDVFVLASTSEVYGCPKVHPQPESYWGYVNPVGERSCYDEGKRFAEALTINFFRKNKINVRIARIFNTYGPNMEKDDGRVISNFIHQALSNQSLTINDKGLQTRSFCYVSDMIEGLFLLATKTKIAGEIINLGNPDEKKIIDIAYLIKKLTGNRSKIVYRPRPADDPEKRKPVIEKARRLLGWQPKISLKEGLSKTIDYFKNIL